MTLAPPFSFCVFIATHNNMILEVLSSFFLTKEFLTKRRRGADPPKSYVKQKNLKKNKKNVFQPLTNCPFYVILYYNKARERQGKTEP